MPKGKGLFKVTKWLMIAGGTWRLKLNGLSTRNQKLYQVYSVTIQAAYLTCLLSLIIKFFYLFGVDHDKAVECLSMLTIVFLMATKTGLCQTKRMTELLAKAVYYDTSSTEYDEYIDNLMRSHTKYSNILNIFITIYAFSLGIHINIISLVELHHFNRKYGNATAAPDKPLLVLYWYPFNYNEHYGIVQIYQLATVLFSDLYNSGIQALFNTFLIDLSVELKILQHRFRNFANDTITGKKLSQNEAFKNLKVLAKKHIQLIEYIKDLNESLRFPIFIEYIVSSLMLAAILVQILSDKKVFFNTQYFLILAIQWLLLSWNANEIIVQSQRLPFALYESLWYEQSEETKRMLFIMVLRSRKPLSFEIGPFGPLTNDAALSRLKLAYSYVSLISGNN